MPGIISMYKRVMTVSGLAKGVWHVDRRSGFVFPFLLINKSFFSKQLFMKKSTILLTGFSVCTYAALGNIFDSQKKNLKINIGHKQSFYEKHLKRSLDFLCATAALVLCSPVLGVVAILVKNKLGAPILFTQDRPGLNGRLFKLYKFRSMTDQRDIDGNLLPDDIRLTKFGKLLRSTSMDELPELFNILRGDMSVVGPRPLLAEYIPYYTEEESHRHDVRPGLTGLAQINGRNAIGSWEERFAYDLEYVNKLSFLMDVDIILKTVSKVLKKTDIQVGSEIKVGRLDKARKNESK